MLTAYSDSDWAGNINDRRSTTDFCAFFGGSLISWKSKKQLVASRSAVKAEYRALARSTSKLVWLQRFLSSNPCLSTVLIKL